MDEKLSKILHTTKKSYKHLRDVLRNLKENAKKEQSSEKILIEKPKKEKSQEITIQFSLMNIAKVTLVVLGLIALTQFLGEIGKILLIFFIAILFSSALNPTVTSLQKYKIPRALSVLVIFLILLLILGFFISQLIPLVVTQIYELAKSLSGLVSKISSGDINLPLPDAVKTYLQNFFNGIDKDMLVQQLDASLKGFAGQLESFAGNTFGAIKTVFNGIFNFFMVLILTFFMVVNQHDVHDFFVSLFPSKHGSYILEKVNAIERKIGYWMRGQVIVMVLMFCLSLIGLLILGVDNALTLAMMTGIAELIPVIGVIIAGIPAILVGFNESAWLGVWVIALIFLLHEIEGNIVVPIVMKKAVDLSPIVVIPVMLIGLETLGIVGMILAIPVATTLSIFVREYAEKEK